MMHYNKATLTVLLFGFLFVANNSSAQKISSVAKAKEISNLLQQHEFIFRAQTAFPMVGGMQLLSPEYDLVVSADSVNCQLPYFGRSFTAPLDITKIGVDFISTDFGYESAPGRKGNQRITVTPRNEREVKYLSLDVSKNGFASLNVIFSNRQAIRYNGYVTKRGS